ncbi:MAG: DsrE family protein [Proteiniphilum sp.]|uniref:DsrE family protein n=1 Tax=Proteiniphilum sp. TaxID=1926877 RepID=UPI0009278C70|nr:DsrE family protein [Proteiniphilum sp.]MEA5126643.1 DsrE family protein [Proteiniphilum sp.]OJV78643.1 MAG: DsrE family protein [Bacteroidia bacterium 44-10]
MNNDKINILWTTDNKDTIFNMLSMYAINSKKHNWWKDVNIILWGASVKLVGSDTQVQTEVLEMLHNGITVEACKDCCDNFNVAETLMRLGVSVRYMGEPLTGYIKAGEKLISI